MAFVASHSRLPCLTTDPTQSNLQKLVAVGNRFNIHTSADSGMTWTNQTGSAALEWQAIASSSDGTVRQVWMRQPTPLCIAPHSCMREVVGVAVVASPSRLPWLTTDRIQCNLQKLAAGADGGSIYTSANSGVTWTAQTGSGDFSWRSIASSSDGTVRQIWRRSPPIPCMPAVMDVTVIVSPSRLPCLMTDPSQFNL